jgi:hypothetical protein
MIKFIQCVKRKPEVSIHDFRRYWKRYQDKATELAKAVNATGLNICTTLAVDENTQVMLLRGTAEPYDGVAELRISNAPRMMEKLADDPARTIWEEFKALQTEFIDLDRSSFFFAAEEVVIRR